ncbi:MAG TPA: cobalamin-binding protein [Nitrospirales bacterium]|nr:cobalamin-binding protein [Nitrospiraceae bacterium]HNP28319.1 cobalamin-binding protein [Nitrospirales bacterium]
MPHIVSLIPSGTEMVCTLGCRDQLVGRSHECDFPSDITHLPVCTQATVDSDGTSQAIQTQVSQRLQGALSLYEVLIDRIQDLQPDIIVTQTQCEVCAVSAHEVQRALHDLVGSSPTLVSLGAQDLSGVWDDLIRVAECLGQQAALQEFLNQAHQRMQDISVRSQQRTSSPTVACIEWMEPLMAAGNWVPELVRLAGGQSVFGQPGKHAPWITWEALAASDPDILLLMPCGFSLARIQKELPVITSHPFWPQLRAVQNQKVFLTDGNQFFNRPGPRLVESLEILAEIFHPAYFQFGHEGQGWQQWVQKVP